MFTKDAIAFYGNKARLAKAAGITRQAVQKWPIDGLVPFMAAIRLEEASGRSLRFDLDLYREREGAVEVGHPPTPPPASVDGSAVNEG